MGKKKGGKKGRAGDDWSDDEVKPEVAAVLGALSATPSEAAGVCVCVCVCVCVVPKLHL